MTFKTKVTCSRCLAIHDGWWHRGWYLHPDYQGDLCPTCHVDQQVRDRKDRRA